MAVYRRGEERLIVPHGIGTSVTERPRYLGVHRNRGDGTFETWRRSPRRRGQHGAAPASK